MAHAIVIGVAIGLCLRFVNGRKTALVLARTAPPFDKPLTLISPLSLDLSLFTRLPAGVDDFCFSDEGTAYAGLPSLGVVYRVAQAAGGGTSKPELFLSGLDNPTGLACDPDLLLVGESSRIAAYSYAGGPANPLAERLPDDGGGLGHRLQRTDEGLLFSVESRCDVCNEKDPLRATLQLVDLNGELQTYSRGLRSISGLAFSSADQSLWAAERSRLFPEPGAAADQGKFRWFDDDRTAELAVGLSEQPADGSAGG